MEFWFRTNMMQDKILVRMHGTEAFHELIKYTHHVIVVASAVIAAVMDWQSLQRRQVNDATIAEWKMRHKNFR